MRNTPFYCFILICFFHCYLFKPDICFSAPGKGSVLPYCQSNIRFIFTAFFCRSDNKLMPIFERFVSEKMSFTCIKNYALNYLGGSPGTIFRLAFLGNLFYVRRHSFIHRVTFLFEKNAVKLSCVSWFMKMCLFICISPENLKTDCSAKGWLLLY